MLTTEEKRLAALTATLVERGLLPKFYRTPRQQRRQARRLQLAISPLLADFGANLIALLEAGAISPVNVFAVNGALLANSEAVGAGLQQAYQDAYATVARGAFNRQAAHILERAGIQLSWDVVEPRAAQVLRDLSFQASDRLMQRITGNVKAVLVDGVEQGLGTREIGTKLRTVIDDISGRQAEGIARTEVNSAANRGNFMAMEEADVEFVQWIAAQDTRTRPDHLAHHGLVIRRGERFPNGLRHPGDRDGPVGSWIACRCAGAAYFPLRDELTQATPFVGRA